LPKLTEFENPLTGKRASIFDIGTLFSMILGVVVLLFVASTGQNIAKAVSNRVPALDTQPESIFRSPVVIQTTAQKRLI
jgi:hypothetical protein